jgi:hypothetical protein
LQNFAAAPYLPTSRVSFRSIQWSLPEIKVRPFSTMKLSVTKAKKVR